MGFAKGKESTEGTGSVLLKGIGTVNVVAVNPTKDELSKLFNATIEKDPEYITEKDGVKSARIDFYLKSVSEKNNGLEFIKKLSYFIRNEHFYNKDASKVQIIDKYGSTAWATKEEVAAGKLPAYAEQYDSCTIPFKPAYKGEEEIVSFLKTFLIISGRKRLDANKGEWVNINNLEEAEAGLTKISSYFKGDFKELKDIINYQPDNKIQAIFGVKSTDDGKEYQDVFSTVLGNRVNKYDKIAKIIDDKKVAGAYANTEFSIEPIHTCSIEATTFTKSAEVEKEAELPWKF